jgi:hypothetical protein
MRQFEPKIITAMLTVFEEVCSHVPSDATSARAFVAGRILECASNGERTHDGLLAAGRRAVIEQFGTVEAIRVKMQ